VKEPPDKRRKTLRVTPRICGESDDRAFGTSNNGRKIKSPTMKSTDAVARLYPIFLEKKTSRTPKKGLTLIPTKPTPNHFSPFSETVGLCRPLSTVSLSLSLSLSFLPLSRVFFLFFFSRIFQWQTIARLLRHCCKGSGARHQSLFFSRVTGNNTGIMELA